MAGVPAAENRIVPEFQLLIAASSGKGDHRYPRFQILVKPKPDGPLSGLPASTRSRLLPGLPRSCFTEGKFPEGSPPEAAVGPWECIVEGHLHLSHTADGTHRGGGACRARESSPSVNGRGRELTFPRPDDAPVCSGSRKCSPCTRPTPLTAVLVRLSGSLVCDMVWGAGGGRSPLLSPARMGLWQVLGTRQSGRKKAAHKAGSLGQEHGSKARGLSKTSQGGRV